MELIDIIDSSLDALAEKNSYSHDMSQAFRNAEKSTGVPAQTLRRVKDYKYYKGNGWGSNPLELDKEEKFKDRVSPIFRRLVQLINDIKQTDQAELLDDYLNYLSSIGIKIDFSGFIPDVRTSDKSASDEAIDIGCSLQSSICKLADKIRDEDSEEALNQNFGPAKEYPKLISLYYRKTRKGKDIEDKTQEKLMNLNLASESYEMIQMDSFDNDKGDN